jgi:hypothetical protein
MGQYLRLCVYYFKLSVVLDGQFTSGEYNAIQHRWSLYGVVF